MGVEVNLQQVMDVAGARRMYLCVIDRTNARLGEITWVITFMG